MDWVNLSYWLFSSIFLSQSLISNLDILTKSVLIFTRVVKINDVIETISVLLNNWFQHLVWHIVLPVFGWWLKTSWMNWVNLYHWLFGTVFFSHCLISNLDILTKGVLIFTRVVKIDDVIETISVLLNDWFQHLMWHIVLPVFGWWLKTSWMDWVNLYHWLFGTVFFSHCLISNLDILTKGVLIFTWVVKIDDIIETISVLLNDWFQHLVWHIVLPVFGWWLKTSWMDWINLYHWLFGTVIFLSQCLISNLNILTKSVLIFTWVVKIDDIIESISVFLNYWFQHLMGHIVLPVFGWWFETSWMDWVNLYHWLFGTVIFLSHCLISNLCVFTKGMLIFTWVVKIDDIIESISVFLNYWFQHLMWHIVLPVFGWWLKTSWMDWVNLSHWLRSTIGLNRVLN